MNQNSGILVTNYTAKLSPNQLVTATQNSVADKVSTPNKKGSNYTAMYDYTTDRYAFPVLSRIFTYALVFSSAQEVA